MRSISIPGALALILLTGFAGTAEAQSGVFGIGGRLSMVRADVDSEADAERFLGGQVRLKVSARAAIEVALDLRTDTNEAKTERVRRLPLQASLLLFPVQSSFSPYVLGGVGWYSERVETLAADEVIDTQSTRRFGSHAGFGAEIVLGRHVGVHADYRYTFLRYGSDDDEPPAAAGPNRILGLGRILPSYEGSMWTAGLTIYF